MCDRHFYYYFPFTDQETDPGLHCQGNGGAPIRFWAACLKENLHEGGTFWAKEAYHLTEAADIDRENERCNFVDVFSAS